jgi:cytochrome c biogenesis protein CcdA
MGRFQKICIVVDYMKMKYFMFSMLVMFVLVFSIAQSQCLTCEEGSIEGAEDEVCVYYFYGQGCLACAETGPFIDEIGEKYSEVHTHKLEIWHDETNRQLFFKFCDVYCLDERLVPIVFIGDKSFIGVESIKDNLENEITHCIEDDCPCPQERVQNVTVIPKTELNIPIIFSAALIDSINPCAFAVLIFMLTYLLALGSKRKILIVGLGYILMVFITYFLAGLGLFTAVETIGISVIFYRVAAVIAIVAGIINIKDFFFYGKGFSLEIPKSRKPMIEKYIRRASLPAALILGFLVSMFELPCTGGVYLAILSMLANNLTRMAAIPYLFLYNFIFVVPLFVILILVARGGSAEKMEKWRVGKRKYMKLLAGLFMIVLGIVMLLELI